MISIRTEHFDSLLDSSLIHLTYMFEERMPLESKEVDVQIDAKPIPSVQKKSLLNIKLKTKRKILIVIILN